MKATRYAIIFIIIISPFVMINYFQARQEIATSFQENHYANVLEKALEDGTNALTLNVELDERGNLAINKEGAVEAFFETICLNFNILDDYGKEHIKNYVPLILIIDYDGVYSYSGEEYYNSNGMTEIKHMFHEKKYFTTTYGNQVIGMTLNDYYYVIDMSKNIQFEGTYDELRSINASYFFNQTQTEIEQLRDSTVIKVIENELLRINLHNEYAKINGVNYDFFIPAGKGNLYSNTIEGVGMLAAIQGLPMGDRAFNMFSLSGSSVKESKEIYGYDDGGTLIYHEEGCPSITGTLMEVFQSEKEAAKAGYIPCYDCN